MSRKKGIYVMAAFGLLCLFLVYSLSVLRTVLDGEEEQTNAGAYYSLPADTSTEDPLQYIAEDFSVDERFYSNLPIVILTIDGEITDYKKFASGSEEVDESVEPYTSGSISIIDQGDFHNCLTDEPAYTSLIEIKKRGHSSFSYDKPQYLIKTVYEDGTKNNTEIFNMGEGDSWVLNGSMADKSMLRNYLPYRVASEIGGGVMGPDSQYCEVLMLKDGTYEYCGVYLLMEAISIGESRVNIDQYNQKNVYTSYIVRRDRFTHFDEMLDTYGRLNGLADEWIGVKYPSEAKLTEAAKRYIEEDFSNIEKVIYAQDENQFKVYDKYIDMDSFVDYFLINEFFGNYDAGEHSTYMYKNSGDRLCIGPVWDFDQAMNNYYGEEMDPYTLAFQTKPFFENLVQDKRFLDCLKKRYSGLRQVELSEEHIFGIIDETVAYLKSARQREWYRWAADYEDGSFENPHNYYLQDYEKDNITISRFNVNYDQELYVIKTYLHTHGNIIQTELNKLYGYAEYNTSMKNENVLFLLIIMTLLFVPSILINRK